ncbi:MAG: hypothetical protein Q9217_004240 [Psora testacea]
MSKRKFADFAEDPKLKVSNVKSPSLNQCRIQGLLDNGKTTLFRSLKVARGFERQKLGRRQKATKADKAETEVARLEEEVAALKDLDLSKTAEIHLYKSLFKTKSIASALPQHVRATVDAARKVQSMACVNVQARLFNSAPVKTAMNEIYHRVRSALDVPMDGNKRPRVQDYAKASAVSVGGCNKTSVQNSPAGDDWEGLADGSSWKEKSDASGCSSQSENYNAYACRFAGSADGSTGAAGHHRHEGSDWSSTEDTLDSRNESSVDESEEPNHPQPGNATRQKNVTSATVKSTIFLPTLSMGGYWSGSEPNSNEEVHDGAGNTPARKNRRGQRARHRIAEMKYKENANHLKKQAQDRDIGWDARVRDQKRRGKGRGSFMNRSRSGMAKRGARGPMSSGANSEPVKPKLKSITDGHLHPSWEAAKRAKEQKASMAFQGKKMVFD